MDFEPETKRMRVVSLHPGVTREKIQEATGFPLLFAPEVAVTAPPTAEELNILRTRIGRVYLGGE
jgi:acyl CoA:acetate/3-ketoacid CoA transferase beta subunit